MEDGFTTVARLSTLPVGGRAIVPLGAGEIALFNVAGELFALDNTCPHRGGPLGEGDVEGGLVYCPLHAWNFDLRTGVSPAYPGAKVRAYRVRVVGEEIQVAPQ